MLFLIEWLITLIIFIVIVGGLYYFLRWALAYCEVNPKVAEGIQLVVGLLIFLVFIGAFLTGSVHPIYTFPR